MPIAPIYKNIMIDRLLRAGPDLSGVQSARSLAYSMAPSTFYLALLVNAPSTTSDGQLMFNTGDEVTYTNYARLAIARSLTGWLGTQGTSAVSSGTSGTICPADKQIFGLCTNSSQTVRYAALCFNNTRASTNNPCAAYWELDTHMNLMNTSPGFYPGLYNLGLTIQLDD